MHAIDQASPVVRQFDPASLQSTRDDSDAKIQALARILKMSAIPLLPRRMISIFLGNEVKGSRFQPADMVVRLMSQCLEGFIDESGGQIIYTTDFEERSEQKETTPVYEVLKTNVETFRLQAQGYVFIQIADQRVVVELRHGRFEGVVEYRIEIHTSGNSQSFFQKWSAYTRNNHCLRGQSVFASGKPIIRSRRYAWDDVVLPHQVRAMLRTHIETFLTHAVQLKAVGMKSRRGLILSGPPGTGKTLVGKVLADTLGVTFLWVLPRHVGSPNDIAEILNAARFLSPAVVLFEDLDLFGEDRHAGQSSILGELMNQLDGVSENDGIVTIATTNRLEVVEHALRNRPGRFDRVIELGLPGMKARRKLLQRLLAAITESDLTQLVAATDGYSPAQLEEVANTMHLLAAESGDKVNGNGLVKITPELINRTVREIGGQRKHGIGFSAKEAVERP